jgi:Ca2+-binding RTX toxin-like protein
VTKKSGGTDPKQQHYENKYPGKNVIIAPDGGGEVYGTNGDDVIVSGSGDDWMEGGEGSDIYVYEAGSGGDVISNVSNGEDDQDELHFGPGIWPEDLTFAREDDDLVVRILDGTGGYAGSVTVEDWYLAETNKLSKIVFDNGTELTTAEIEALASNPPSVVRGTTAANILRTSSPVGGSVILYGLAGLDTIYGGAGLDVIVPGPGNDVIYTRATLEGGGKKVFWLNRGDGNDTVYYLNAAHEPGDGLGILRFGDGITPEDVEIRNSGNNVVFALTDGSARVTFMDANRGDVRYQPDEIRFSDGTTMAWHDAAQRRIVKGTEIGEVLLASSHEGESVTVYGLGGLDTIYAGAGEDIIVPGPGNDVVYARSTVEGGGQKTFVWNAGDGNDTVNYINTEHQPGDGLGILIFGSGIGPEDVEVRNSGNNVVVALLDGSGSVTFVNANRGGASCGQSDRG